MLLMQSDEEEEDPHAYTGLMCSEDENSSSSAAMEQDEEVSSGAEDAYFPSDATDAAGISSSQMQGLQDKLQLHNQSLGRSMHGGDDEGREPGAEAAERRAKRRAKRRREQQQQQASDEESDNARSRAAGKQARAANQSSRRCWLCTFANCKMAKQVSTFVSTNAGTMDPAIMADQIKREVLKEYPAAKGIGRRHILRHIREHVLIPGACSSCRVARHATCTP